MGDYSNEPRGTLILYLPIKSKSCTMQCLLQAKQSKASCAHPKVNLLLQTNINLMEMLLKHKTVCSSHHRI
jgi:hypothetical protein